MSKIPAKEVDMPAMSGIFVCRSSISIGSPERCPALVVISAVVGSLGSGMTATHLQTSLRYAERIHDIQKCDYLS